LKNQTKAYILALLAVGFWSTIATAFNLSLKYISLSNLLLLASFTSMIITGGYILLTGKHKLFATYSIKNVMLAVFAGFINPFLYYLLLLRAYELLPAQEAGTLNYFWPVVLVLLSIPLLKQKISLKSFAAIVVSFVGIVVISTHGHPLAMQFSNTTGVILALSCPFLWAFYWILNMKNPMDDVIKLFINFASGFAFILLTVFLSGQLEVPNFYGLIGSIYVGMFEMGITFLLWLKALKYSSSTAKISNLVFLSPFVSLLFISFLVGEEIRVSTLAGLFLIIAGILLQQSMAAKQKQA
jgi:drug/metabolite transporter (DMT)-like permease